MAQRDPSPKYRNHLLDPGNEVMDASLNRTNVSLAQKNTSLAVRSPTLLHKNSSLFTGKKERLQAMKVQPYPPGEATTTFTRTKSMKFQVGNVVFSKIVERGMLGAVAGFFGLIYLDFCFQPQLSSSTLDFISFAFLLLFALHESIKFYIIGCVSPT